MQENDLPIMAIRIVGQVTLARSHTLNVNKIFRSVLFGVYAAWNTLQFFFLIITYHPLCSLMRDTYLLNTCQLH